MSDARTPTAIDALADSHVDAVADLDPVAATFAGVAGHDDRLPDYTPDWWASLASERARVLAALDTTEAADVTDRVTVAALRDHLDIEQQRHAAGEDERLLNNLESPLQMVRDVFDLTPSDTVEQWSTIAKRLSGVPASLEGYVVSLRTAAARGDVSALRQVQAGAKQAGDNVGPDGFFARFAADARAGDQPLPATLQAEVERHAQAASQAYEQLAAFLRDELAPQAADVDPVGRERYALASRLYLGTRIDIDETYEWGIAELASIRAEMAEIAERITPGGSVTDAMAALDADVDRQLDGTDALKAWMQRTSDAAVEALAGTHFDIPDEIRRLECRIAPTQTGGIYYTGPSDDLVTRPGRMWWSVPAGQTRFTTWQELTTVYHEGVPGHHLQIAQTTYRKNLLNRWRRLLSWVSGHGEGWALYAEKLMADLGFLDDPGDRLGMLGGQSLRAARVVIDIGVHCGLPAPDVAGGGEWTYDKAWEFLLANSTMDEKVLRFELERYLGWPGQAPSYKIGERHWLELREDARTREGDAFDLRAFHRRALDVGSLGLDVLRSAVLGEI